jgi:outer membrane receptor protein involved in Fe transport
VGNVGSAVSKGFDLESQFRPVEFLSLGLSGGYTDATYSETVHGGADSIITEKGESIGVPKWSGAAFSQTEFPAFGLKAYARADFQFIGAGPNPDPNVYGYDPALYASGETKLLKLRVGALIEDWNVSVYANNVTNDHPVLSRGHDTISSPLFNSYTYPPRMIGVTATMRF